MIALAVMMFAAFAISSIQTSAFISMKVSDVHFEINEKTEDMLEILRANKTKAKSGDYNFDFESTVDPDATVNPILLSIANWKRHIQDELPDGAGQISCDSSRCQVSIRWKENIDGTYTEHFFNMAGLM